MKKNWLFVLLILSACSAEKDRPVVEDLVFSAVMDETKTVLNGLDVLWSSGDEIAIVDKAGTKVLYTTADDGTSTATFVKKDGESGTLGDGPYTAWYPANISEGYLPATQVYSWNSSECTVSEVRAPMYAVSPNTTLVFRNLCALLKLNIKTTQSGVNIKRIMLASDEGMSGSFTVNGNNAAIPDHANPVSALMTNAVGINSTVRSFYIYLPEGSYSNLTIRLDNSGNTLTRTLKYKGVSFDVARNQLITVDLPVNDFSAPEQTADGLKMVYAESESVSIVETGGAVLWVWAPGTTDFSDIDEVKPVIYGGDECLLVTSNAGGVALVRVSDKSVLFNVSLPLSGPHSAEVLPDGNIAIACATSGEILVYTINGAFVSSTTCSSAHNAVWSKYDSCFWATDETRLIRFSYSGGVLSEDSSYLLPSYGAHDLYPVYGENALWLSTSAYVHKFNLGSCSFVPVSMVYAPNVKSVSSGPANSHPTIIVSPDSGLFRSARVQTIDGAVVRTVNTAAQYAIYKARWLIYDNFPQSGSIETWQEGDDASTLFE